MKQIRKTMILRLGTAIMAFVMIATLVNSLNVQAARSSGRISLSKASISVKELLEKSL